MKLNMAFAAGGQHVRLAGQPIALAKWIVGVSGQWLRSRPANQPDDPHLGVFFREFGEPHDLRGGRVPDASAASEQNRHFQSATAHVLHFRYLVNDFAKGIVDEVDEHEVDDRPCTRHRRAAA